MSADLAIVGAAAAGAYLLSQQGTGSGVSLTGAVPAGTTVTVSVAGYDTLATLFSSNAYGNPLESRFQAQIAQDGAGYVVTGWTVTGTPLTSAAFDNQVPYSGTFTIQTTTSFGQGSDLQASIIGEFYAVTGYEPTVNVSGGSAGIAGSAVNATGLGSFLSGLFGNLGTTTVVILVGLAVLIWVERDSLVKRIP